MTQTITKADKILKRKEFLELQSAGKKVTNRYFVVMIARGGTGRTRLGITVSKKVGKAFTRNRIKRISREYFRKNREIFHSNLDINLIAKKSCAELSTAQAFSAFQDLYKRIAYSFES